MPHEMGDKVAALPGGERRQLDGPESLDGDHRVWLLRSGSVEIYRLHPRGRQFMMRVTSGEILYPAAHAAQSAGFGLQAIGQQAELEELLPTAFAAALSKSEEARGWLVDWCHRLGECVDLAPAPDRCVPLAAGHAVGLRREESAVSDRRLCWVRIVAGDACLLGDPKLAVEVGALLPLPRPLWLTALSPDTKLEVQASEALDASALAAVDQLQTLIMRYCAQRAADHAAAEQERFWSKAQAEGRRLQDALSDLATVSAGRARQSPFDGLARENPLLAACQIVGKALDMPISAPPLGRTARQASDPVAAIAQASRLRHRRVMLRSNWWQRDNGPLVAFTKDDDRPVALVLTGRRYMLLDPVSQKAEKLTAEIAADLKPVAVSLLPVLPPQALGPLDLVRAATAGRGRDALMLLGCGLMAGLLGLAVPLSTQLLFDEVIPLADHDRLIGLTGLLLLFALVASAFELTRGLVMLRVEGQGELRLQAGIMDRLLRLPSDFFRRYSTGDLAMRTLGISMARRTVTAATLTGLMTGMFSIVNLGLLFLYDLQLAVLGLAIAAIAAVVIYGRARVMLFYSRQMMAQEGRVSSVLLQILLGVAKLRVAGAEKRAFSVWAEAFARQKRLAFRSGVIQNHFELFQATYPLLASIAIFAAVYLATESVAAHLVTAAGASLSAGSFVAVITAFSQFLIGFTGFGLSLLGALQAVPLFERARPILETLPENRPGCDDPGVLSGAIELSKVRFRYSENGPQVLDDLSLAVAPGQMVAIVGPSGSGKSTLMRLLLGLETPNDGDIHFDGQNLANLDVEAVRRQIGTVLQKDRLQPGDVFHNIVGPSSSLTLSDAWDAARAAGLEADIKALPMGMNTYVNEGATTFSGGQRQRLMIARAIAHKPRILLFDEATSALDNRTQEVVSDALAGLHVTRIVIAHRLSTIERADRIDVLDAGRVVETGSYDELIAANGLFASLARRQLE